MSAPQQSSKPTKASTLSSHFAMIELKQKILTSLSKLSDRDTHQIAVEDLEKTIQTLSSEGIPMFLNCLYEASGDPKPAVKKESLRLLGFVCAVNRDLAAAHLAKIIAHVVRRLKDSDSGVRDSCRDVIGVLAALYLKGESDNGNGSVGSVLALFVKPLFEAMGEQNKVVQGGAALCMAKMVDCVKEPSVVGFQKLCPRICKYLNSPNFLAKAALLPVVASLSQVGAIAPQSLQTLLQSIHECLQSSDWGTRKAAAEALSSLASHSSHLVADGASSTIAVLEACRFDKVKPVRDSMNEALQLWKRVVDKGEDKASDGPNSTSHGEKNSKMVVSAEKPEPKNRSPVKDISNSPSQTSDSLLKAKLSSISDKTVGILKKKAPALSDKEINPDFFQKLETRRSDDLPVEVVLPRKCLNTSASQAEEESEHNDTDYGSGASYNRNGDLDGVHGLASVRNRDNGAGTGDLAQDKWSEQRPSIRQDSKATSLDADDRIEANQRDASSGRTLSARTEGQEGSQMNSKGNWLAIQRQLSQLERQQAHLMNMLQDFMGGSHDSMITLENRVRGLERVVEDMARDLAISSGRRGGNFMMGFEGSSNRSLSKYNGLHDYSGTKFGRGSDTRVSFAERFPPLDGIVSGSRGRDHLWRSDMSEAWDSYAYGTSRNGHIGSRRALNGASSDVRPPRSEQDVDHANNRRGWDKGPGSVRLGEGPSARSVWQASKDEATLEAIRVAGEDNGTSRAATRIAMPELTAEAMGDDNAGQERGPIWSCWSNAMDALHVGDVDTAYAEVLSTGDDFLLVKLMDRSGPVVDQLSNETVSEVLHAVGQFLLEQDLFDIGLSWVQQLTDLVLENGPDVLGIPLEIRRELLSNLHEASSAVIDMPEEWEGATPDQLMMQLASAWGVDLQHFEK
ncbi:hypothetical protein Syun_027004 [Stephania yunnanensis]|uniref:TOG domain-containing protein n=1 Tax=Stephania yunnanensis TaxID=152371 RepID=A0AAP0EM56_9MAGN